MWLSRVAACMAFLARFEGATKLAWVGLVPQMVGAERPFSEECVTTCKAGPQGSQIDDTEHRGEIAGQVFPRDLGVAS